MKRIFAIVLVLMLALSVAAMAEEVDLSILAGKTIGFAQCDNRNSWRIAETDSMQAVAEEVGATLIATDAGADLAKQASDIESLVAQNVDFLVVAPQEEDGLQSALQEAMDKGIPVILVDRNINGEAGVHYVAAIMSDFVWEAEQVANLFIADSGDSGNIVILQGTQGATSTIDRQKGFMDVIEKSNMKVIADQVADYVMDKGQEVMENILQAQGDEVNYVFAHNDDMALGAIKAIEAAGKVPGVDNQGCRHRRPQGRHDRALCRLYPRLHEVRRIDDLILIRCNDCPRNMLRLHQVVTLLSGVTKGDVVSK